VHDANDRCACGGHGRAGYRWCEQPRSRPGPAMLQRLKKKCSARAAASVGQVYTKPQRSHLASTGRRKGPLQIVDLALEVHRAATTRRAD
jgi:hypothetical protein